MFIAPVRMHLEPGTAELFKGVIGDRCRRPALHLEDTVEVLGISDKFRRLDPELEGLILGCVTKA